MKKLMIIVTTLLLSSFSFASGNLTKQSMANNVSMALKSKPAKNINLQDDINIVYGGQDLSPRHQLVNANVLV